MRHVIASIIMMGGLLTAVCQADDSSVVKDRLAPAKPKLRTTDEKREWLRRQMVKGLRNSRDIRKVRTQVDRMARAQIDAFVNNVLAQQMPANQQEALEQAQFELQRARWLRGTHDASRQFARKLLVQGLTRRDAAKLDGAFQAYAPSYSTLTAISVLALGLQLTINRQIRGIFSRKLLGAWLVLVSALFGYPLMGLALERAPSKAYFAILSGPVFIVWRSWLALKARFGTQAIPWIRTEHGAGS